MLRTPWYLVNLFWWTFFYGGVTLVAALFRVRNRPNGVYDWCTKGWSRRMLAASGVHVSAVGLDKIPQGPVVFVSNHQSWFDIWVLQATLPGQVRFIAKKELTKIPFFGRAMVRAGHLTIDRQNRQKAFDAYEEAAGAIRGGMSAVVFAEGTRSRTGDLLPFKKGPFVLGIAAGVPIVPVYVAGTFSILPKGTVRVTPRPVTLMVGDPINPVGMVYDDRERLMQQVRAQVERLRDEVTV
jgi:1-acyl-sn-glycerol-3-phosphate acyltransferase